MRILRQHKSGKDLSALKRVEPSTDDMKVGMILAFQYLDFALEMNQQSPSQDRVVVRTYSQRQQGFFRALPQQFETKDAVRIAEDLDISERTAKGWLKKWSDLNQPDRQLLTKLAHGEYEKYEPESKAGFISCISIIFDILENGDLMDGEDTGTSEDESASTSRTKRPPIPPRSQVDGGESEAENSSSVQADDVEEPSSAEDEQ